MTARLPRLEQTSLAKRAYDELKIAILSGRFAPGSQLAEVELAQALGISRTPVREALARLRADGLAVAVSGGGNVVHTASETEDRELFLVREALEQLAVKEWAAHPHESGIPELKQLIEEQRRAQGEGNAERFLDADERFHFAISRQAGLTQTADILMSLRERMRLAGLGAIAQSDRQSRVIDEHTAILRALQAGDPVRGVRALQRHLAATRAALEAHRRSRRGKSRLDASDALNIGVSEAAQQTKPHRRKVS